MVIRPWDTNNPLLVSIFNAALTGLIANPNFFGPIHQQSPIAAVDFADQVVLAAGGGRWKANVIHPQDEEASQ